MNHSKRILVLLSLVVSLAHAESVSTTAEDKTINVLRSGGASFGVERAGGVLVRVTAPRAISVELVGPLGSVGTKSGKGTVELTTQATAAMIEKGKVWSVNVTTNDDAAFSATVHLEHLGRSFAESELVAQFAAKTGKGTGFTGNPKAWAPPGLPAQVSAAQAAAAQVKGGTVTLEGIGAGIRSKQIAAAYVPRPVKGAAAAGTPGNSYGGSSSTPAPAGRTFVPIRSIVVSGDPANPAARQCTASCGVVAGATLMITTDPGLNAAGHEVHFVDFATNGDLTVTPVAWSDSSVVVTVPRIAGGAVSGALYLGVPNAPVQSTFYGFNYTPNAPTIVSQWVKWERMSPVGIRPADYSFRTQSFAWPEYSIDGNTDDGNFYTKLRQGPFGTGACSGPGCPHDTFFGGFHLKNGWKVKEIHFMSHPLGAINGFATLAPFTRGTDEMEATVYWGYAAGGGYEYEIGWELEGPDNTNPWY